MAQPRPINRIPTIAEYNMGYISTDLPTRIAIAQRKDPDEKKAINDLINGINSEISRLKTMCSPQQNPTPTRLMTENCNNIIKNHEINIKPFVTLLDVINKYKTIADVKGGKRKTRRYSKLKIRSKRGRKSIRR
jgi:hypothetical protein